MAIRRLTVGLAFVSFFSIGLGTVIAEDWNTVALGKCTRGDGVVYKVMSKPAGDAPSKTHFGVKKCKDGSCEWKRKKGISEEEARKYVESKGCTKWSDHIAGDGDKMTMLIN